MLKVSLITAAFVLAAVLAAGIVSRTSSEAKLVMISIFVVLSLIAALALRLSFLDLGLDPKNILKGIFVAIPFMLTIIGVAGIIYVLSPSIFHDVRYNQSARALLVTVFFYIPIVTVLLEELYFRGIVLGFLLQHTQQLTAIIVSSVSFGLWHLFTAKSVELSQLSFAVPSFLIVIGVLLVTTLAGMVLSWVRIRSGSLITPILIHWTINATGAVFAFFAWKQT